MLMMGLVKELRGKNIGKIIIALILLAITCLSFYKTYYCFKDIPVYESGVVLGKNETMTTGKYPKQHFIIAFKFDNPKYGTRDIVTAFHTWNSLEVGDRAKFVPKQKTELSDVLYMLWSIIALGIIVGEGIFFIGKCFIELWKF